MASKIAIYQKDNGIKLYVSITKDNLIESILGSRIDIKMKGANTGTEIIKSTHALTQKDIIEIVDAEMGEICITLWEKDTQVVDSYNLRITTTYANETKLTTDDIRYDGSKAIIQIKEPVVKFE